MRFEPFHHFIQIEKLDLAELKKTKSGIIIPENLAERATAFKVVAAGPGFFDVVSSTLVPMTVKVGDIVLVDTNAVINVSYGGRDCNVCPETSVFGKLVFEVKPPEDEETDEEPDKS